MPRAVAVVLLLGLAAGALADGPPAPAPVPGGATPVPAAAPGAPVPAPTPPGAPAAGEDKALARALEIESELVQSLDRVRRSSVTVLQQRRVRADGPLVVAGAGSGVLVAKKGLWVLTNVHVVRGGDAVQIVAIDGKRYPMRVEDMIERYDIALLGFPEGAPKGLKGVPVKAGPVLSEGTWVVATGNPFFLAADGQPVATLGVVSGLDRILGQGFLYGKAIQHDAEVNPGNSGGPLWSLRGEFLGINGMIAFAGAQGEGAHNTGAAFSIPAEQVLHYLDAMIDKRKDAQAGDLPIVFETATDEKGNAAGARVTKSTMGPKGLAPGDVVTKLTVKGKSGTAIRTASDLTNALSLCPAGTTVSVLYRRAKKIGTWEGTLGGT